MDCLKMSDNSNWTTEDFKLEYTIQFPSNYEGTGMVGFEGNFFSKNRIDDKVSFNYSFCGPLLCLDFGEALASTATTEIIVIDRNNNEVILASKKEFCSNGMVEGILYHNTDASSMGKYYMKQDSEYLEGLTVYFDYSEYSEVERIIQTITKQ